MRKNKSLFVLLFLILASVVMNAQGASIKKSNRLENESEKLGDLSSISFSFRKIESGQVHLNLKLDAECDGVFDQTKNDRVWTPASLTNSSDHWATQFIDREVAGMLSPDQKSSTLNEFLVNYPKACLLEESTKHHKLKTDVGQSSISLTDDTFTSLTNFDVLVHSVALKNK